MPSTRASRSTRALIDYITSGPVVLMVLEGPNAVAVTRSTMGKTNPVEAAPGTIRGDLGLMTGRNLIHGSDATESAEREIALFSSATRHAVVGTG